MRYELPRDPETLKFLKLRSLVGAAALLASAGGFASLAALAPPSPTHFAVNCFETSLSPTLSDAAPDRYGCTPPGPPAAPKGPARSGYPAPAADATTDDPPIATF